jgi:hypothetical protein
MSNVETLVATWRARAASFAESWERNARVESRVLSQCADALESALAADRRAEDRGGVDAEALTTAVVKTMLRVNDDPQLEPCAVHDAILPVIAAALAAERARVVGLMGAAEQMLRYVAGDRAIQMTDAVHDLAAAVNRIKETTPPTGATPR